MKWYFALLVTLLFFAAGMLIPRIEAMYIMVLATALWAAIDSAKIHLHEYESGISCRPVFLFIGICLLWIVAFPWYLIVRGRITSGVQDKKIPKDANHYTKTPRSARPAILAFLGLLAIGWFLFSWQSSGKILSPVGIIFLVIFTAYAMDSRKT